MNIVACILFALFFLLLLILVIGGALHMSGQADAEIDRLTSEDSDHDND